MSRAARAGVPVALIVGTRPEAVKLGPVAAALAATGWARPRVLATGQHPQGVGEILALFGVACGAQVLPATAAPADLGSLSEALFGRLHRELSAAPPALVLVQGDTASAFAGAMAAFHLGIAVAHVEAGLRSGDLAAPWPEEGYRRMITAISTLHLAPTAGARDNLLAEGVAACAIAVTGNPVVDAVRRVAALGVPPGHPLAAVVAAGTPLVVATAHRREAWESGLADIGRGLAAAARRHREATFVVAGHVNPETRRRLQAPLSGTANVVLSGPLPYQVFAPLLAAARLAVTDSGGLQEEAVALRVPVLVARDVTERPEGVAAGVAEVVGTRPVGIAAAITRVLTDGARHAAMASTPDLYGDGNAGVRIAELCGTLLGLEHDARGRRRFQTCTNPPAARP